MKIIVPFATKAPMIQAVQIALRQDGHEPLYVHCKHEEDYFNLVAEHWEAKEDFCVIEHDIVIWPGALQELEDCEELWCVRPYYCSVGWIIDGLGCTKFSSEMMTKYSDFFKEPFPKCCMHTKNYCGLDRLIAHRMMDLEIKPHIHNPGVSNLNDKWT
jgi:hypothetical protein